jgi:hypothetical protein
MNIKIDTTISAVLIFLKKEYELYVDLENDSISKIKTLPIIKNSSKNYKKSSENIFYTIKEDTVALDLVKLFRKENNLYVILRNKSGLRVPTEFTLKQVKNIPFIPKSTKNINNYFDVANGLIKSGDYYNVDWVVRILEKAVYKSKSKHEKWLILKYLIALFEEDNQLTFKQNMAVIKSCFNEKEDFVKIYNILLETNNQNALSFADKFHSDCLGE